MTKQMTFSITLDVIPREGQTFQEAAKELTEGFRKSFLSGAMYEDFSEGWGGYNGPFYTVSENNLQAKGSEMFISMTPAQAKVVETLTAPAIVPTKAEDAGVLYVYDIPGDDITVILYVIAPDGTYYTESLEDGLGGGWTARDSEGNEISMARVTIHAKSWYVIEVPDHVAEKGDFAIMEHVARKSVSLENISLDNGVLYEEVVEVD